MKTDFSNTHSFSETTGDCQNAFCCMNRESGKHKPCSNGDSSALIWPLSDIIFTAFHKWIGQPSKIDRADYDGNNQAYWQEVRSINKDRTRARKALREAKKYDFDAALMADALKHSFSRLSWNAADNYFEYCIGQYFPTEFAVAAAVVLEAYVHAVRPKFTPTPEQKNQWWSIDDIEKANYNAGMHWFSKDTKRFFRSRILPTVHQGPGGIYFVSSEKGPSEKRLYTVRKFNPETANISTFGEFNALSKYRAESSARIAAQYPKAAKEIIHNTVQNQ